MEKILGFFEPLLSGCITPCNSCVAERGKCGIRIHPCRKCLMDKLLGLFEPIVAGCISPCNSCVAEKGTCGIRIYPCEKCIMEKIFGFFGPIFSGCTSCDPMKNGTNCRDPGQCPFNPKPLPNKNSTSPTENCAIEKRTPIEQYFFSALNSHLGGLVYTCHAEEKAKKLIRSLDLKKVCWNNRRQIVGYQKGDRTFVFCAYTKHKTLESYVGEYLTSRNLSYWDELAEKIPKYFHGRLRAGCDKKEDWILCVVKIPKEEPKSCISWLMGTFNRLRYFLP
ncbi:unnamed protein product [Cylicocyclus nassatus]|uniref:Uncharacterized protein n=1 Tax=Cylicocyclus nassatus TaxID=53992 RepID=A0AA36GFW3_CYLNA|nr:unnamed protein product [Cylicocyclus nassatus]